MGSYTSTQNFYLIGGSDLVNVDQDLNYNLQRADERVRPLVEYQITDVPSISVSSLPKDVGFKWYKTYTNSIWTYRDGNIWQDANASVDTWNTDVIFESGFGNINSEEGRIAYSIRDGFVHWRGRLVLTNGDEFTQNTMADVLTIPEAARPVRQKYFTVYGGDAATGTRCFRVFIPQAGAADVRMEVIRYGSSASTSAERYVSLNDVFYALDDTDV